MALSALLTSFLIFKTTHANALQLNIAVSHEISDFIWEIKPSFEEMEQSQGNDVTLRIMEGYPTDMYSAITSPDTDVAADVFISNHKKTHDRFAQTGFVVENSRKSIGSLKLVAAHGYHNYLTIQDLSTRFMSLVDIGTRPHTPEGQAAAVALMNLRGVEKLDINNNVSFVIDYDFILNDIKLGNNYLCLLPFNILKTKILDLLPPDEAMDNVVHYTVLYPWIHPNVAEEAMVLYPTLPGQILEFELAEVEEKVETAQRLIDFILEERQQDLIGKYGYWPAKLYKELMLNKAYIQSLEKPLATTVGEYMSKYTEVRDTTYRIAASQPIPFNVDTYNEESVPRLRYFLWWKSERWTAFLEWWKEVYRFWESFGDAWNPRIELYNEPFYNKPMISFKSLYRWWLLDPERGYEFSFFGRKYSFFKWKMKEDLEAKEFRKQRMEEHRQLQKWQEKELAEDMKWRAEEDKKDAMLEKKLNDQAKKHERVMKKAERKMLEQKEQ